MKGYEVRKKYMVIYLCLIAVGAYCVISRWLTVIDPKIRLLPGFLLSHISNFTLCMMVLLIFGFIAILFGAKLKIVTIAALLIAVLGIVYECFLPFLNTSDIWDAVFGTAGTAVAYIYLVMLKRNGLVANVTLDETEEVIFIKKKGE